MSTYIALVATIISTLLVAWWFLHMIKSQNISRLQSIEREERIKELEEERIAMQDFHDDKWNSFQQEMAKQELSHVVDELEKL